MGADLPAAGLGGLPDLSPGSRSALTGPAAAEVAASWERLAGTARVLTHHDYWSGNVVWACGALTGVVDWPGAGPGPPGRADLTAAGLRRRHAAWTARRLAAPPDRG